MDTRQQRIEIAEACGWIIKQIQVDGVPDVCILPPNIPDTSENVWRFVGTNLPDYVNDLNAMHEAEKVLKGSIDDEHSEVSGYSENLTTVIYGEGELESIWFADLIRATASQRAEAFLRTIGKWIE